MPLPSSYIYKQTAIVTSLPTPFMDIRHLQCKKILSRINNHERNTGCWWNITRNNYQGNTDPISNRVRWTHPTTNHCRTHDHNNSPYRNRRWSKPTLRIQQWPITCSGMVSYMNITQHTVIHRNTPRHYLTFNHGLRESRSDIKGSIPVSYT